MCRGLSSEIYTFFEVYNNVHCTVVYVISYYNTFCHRYFYFLVDYTKLNKTISSIELEQSIIVLAFRQSNFENHNTDINFSKVKHLWERCKDYGTTYFK